MSHKDASRLKWDLYSLMAAVIESRSRVVGMSSFILAPRRDMLDLSSVSLTSIETAAAWRAANVSVMEGDAAATAALAAVSASSDSASVTAPTGFLPSLLPCSVNYRFAPITEDMVFDRLISAASPVGENDGAAEPLAPASLTHSAAPPPVQRGNAGGEDDCVLLSPGEELELLARSRLMRGWRRALIGEDVLRIIRGQPIAWTWDTRDAVVHKGQAKLQSPSA